ncbi:unnamed protein product [Onchocerca flexuosa]|uniref:Uncharacterized protein n=1 Tax=Onchocerca flexuosa TaxID=387005 RepID=A0A183H2K9_9BILA|nr:unnamed protein product [Onchocerca flexuosa]
MGGRAGEEDDFNDTDTRIDQSSIIGVIGMKELGRKQLLQSDNIWERDGEYNNHPCGPRLEMRRGGKEVESGTDTMIILTRDGIPVVER